MSAPVKNKFSINKDKISYIMIISWLNSNSMDGWMDGYMDGWMEGGMDR